MRKSDVLFEASRPVPGPIFSFVPADGDSRAGAVAQQVNRTLTEGLGAAVLLANFEENFELLHRSEAIFIVSSSRPESLDAVVGKVASLRRLGLEDRCALLLHRVAGGVSAPQAEDRTGLALCGLIETNAQIETLAQWIAASAESHELALAG